MPWAVSQNCYCVVFTGGLRRDNNKGDGIKKRIKKKVNFIIFSLTLFFNPSNYQICNTSRGFGCIWEKNPKIRSSVYSVPNLHDG
jgi:hypothetical protein